MSFKLSLNYSILFSLLLLAGCKSPWTADPNSASPSNIPTDQEGSFSGQPSDTLVPRDTPDPCVPENLLAEIKKVNNPFLEFEQIMFIVRYTPSDQLIRPIMELQTVNWEAQTQDPPACLDDLKQRRDAYFNSVIAYLAHYMGGQKADVLEPELQNSTVLRQAYEIELSLLTEVNTPTPLPTATVKLTEAAASTPGSPAAEGTPQPVPSSNASTPTETWRSNSPTAVHPPIDPTVTPDTRGSVESGTIPVTGGQGGEMLWLTQQGTTSSFISPPA